MWYYSILVVQGLSKPIYTFPKALTRIISGSNSKDTSEQAIISDTTLPPNSMFIEMSERSQVAHGAGAKLRFP